MIRNIDRIRKMSLEELAPLLVYSKEIDIGAYDYDENPIPWYQTVWFSPSGRDFWDYGEDGKQEAIEDCIKWLDSEWDGREYNEETRQI